MADQTGKKTYDLGMCETSADDLPKSDLSPAEILELVEIVTPLTMPAPMRMVLDNVMKHLEVFKAGGEIKSIPIHDQHCVAAVYAAHKAWARNTAKYLATQAT